MRRSRRALKKMRSKKTEENRAENLKEVEENEEKKRMIKNSKMSKKRYKRKETILKLSFNSFQTQIEQLYLKSWCSFIFILYIFIFIFYKPEIRNSILTFAAAAAAGFVFFCVCCCKQWISTTHVFRKQEIKIMRKSNADRKKFNKSLA